MVSIGLPLSGLIYVCILVDDTLDTMAFDRTRPLAAPGLSSIFRINTGAILLYKAQVTCIRAIVLLLLVAGKLIPACTFF